MSRTVTTKDSVSFTIADAGDAWGQEESDALYHVLQNGEMSSGAATDLVNDTTPQLGGDLDVNSQSIVTVSNGDMTFAPHGTGKIVLHGVNWPVADGTTNYFLQTNGSGQLAWASAGGISNVVDDLTPQLGADLDVNDFDLLDSNGNEILVFVKQANAVNEVNIYSVNRLTLSETHTKMKTRH